MNRQSRICRKNPNLPESPDRMIDDDFVKALLEGRDFISVKHRDDCLTLDCSPDALIGFCKHLRDDQTFDLLVDLTAIDHGEEADSRFSGVLHLYSLIHKSYVRLHVLAQTTNLPPFHRFLYLSCG